MKKVVHLTSVHQRYDQRILWRECCSLREHGYDVTLIVNDAKENETLENGIKILSTGFVPSGRRQRMTEGVQRVYELGIAQNADFYHLHDPELLRIAMKLKRQKKKVIFDSHEIFGEGIKGKEWLSLFSQLVSFSYNAYETYICRRIDGVVCPTSYNGENWFEGRANHFAYVGNFPRREEYRNSKSVPYFQRRNVCFAGWLDKERGILTMLQAAKMANTRLVLAGRFESDQFFKEFTAADIHHIAEYVGVLNREEIFDLYSQCAIGLCTIPDNGGQRFKLDNFNTKVYEYMSAEMPIILSDWPYKRKMVEKYRFGLVADPSDANDVAEKIKWLLEHPAEAEEMGKNGKQLLEERFTWDVAERELLRLYSEIE